MNAYLQKRALFPPLIEQNPSLDLEMIITIPAYNEANLLESLKALKNCDLPECAIEVLVLINDSERSPEEVQRQNQETLASVQAWAITQNTPRLNFHILYKKLAPKHAGVGLARKILMDEAVVRFDQLGKANGIIVCFDADSKCLPNYFKSIRNGFLENPKGQACSIHFEHPLEGEDFELEIYEAIIEYELHLRYYIQAQEFTGFPFAVQTIGSAMAVRSEAYQKQGGMNRRKAGEDFYFLHKFTPLGHFFEIKDTMVIPSPRVSDRVPFGTGKAVGDRLEAETKTKTYNPLSILELRAFFKTIDVYYTATAKEQVVFLDAQSEQMKAFLEAVNVQEKLEEIKANTTTLAAFRNRFFRWFNAFMVMKCLHFLRDHAHENVEVTTAAKWLLEAHHGAKVIPDTAKDLLLCLRTFDQHNT